MATYTDDQITRYLTHIDNPITSAEAARLAVQSDPLPFLTTLQHHHMARVPFESLSLHYSPHRTLSLDPSDLFDKIVHRGRGGYCMEVNCFFGTVLRSLGYTLYSAGGRVLLGGVVSGWNHMLNILTISNQKYAIDVGFGSQGPVSPLPLISSPGSPAEFETIAPAQGRLEYRPLSVHTDPAQKVWVYSWRRSPDEPWGEMYAFVETEFFPADFDVMNLKTMTAPTSFFVQNVMCLRIVLDEGTRAPTGAIILHRDFVKIRISGQPETVTTLKTEKERIEALEQHFGIVLTEKEQKAIAGLASEIRGATGHA
ncbi:hypothetical protein QBC47DRAFT_338280 [Echria macrotheca]|uniref:Arylamine N-acetyltransferase n=1 Tax=Echria macrotheca TaxID=438768 RepID=A0AAJ0BKA4_9PEZI|nr:hypothetical protein QBC47DRAFT_338280 [Echria macrotheca]